MIHILVTGAHGQLGNEIQALHERFVDQGYIFVFTDVEQLDITDREQLSIFFNRNRFDVIINCAAYTAVDKAENERDVAFNVNVEAPRLLVEAANKMGALFIHFSTDYVFKGDRCIPLKECDSVSPQSIYAESKAEGERVVMEQAERAVIFRTSWLYSQFGSNFVATMRRLGNERDRVNVVFDQVGTPTNAYDLALCMLTNLRKFMDLEKPELFHYSNEGVASWYDFAHAVMELSGILCDVLPIRTEEYPLPAARPAFSLLDKQKIKAFTGTKIPHWLSSLRLCIEQIDEEEIDR